MDDVTILPVFVTKIVTTRVTGLVLLSAAVAPHRSAEQSYDGVIRGVGYVFQKETPS